MTKKLRSNSNFFISEVDAVDGSHPRHLDAKMMVKETRDNKY